MRDGFVLTALTLQLLVTPATAQTQSLEQPECNSSNISSLSEKIERMKESGNKSTAETEIGIAKDMLVNGDQENCKEHLLKAMLQTK